MLQVFQLKLGDKFVIVTTGRLEVNNDETYGMCYLIVIEIESRVFLW